MRATTASAWESEVSEGLESPGANKGIVPLSSTGQSPCSRSKALFRPLLIGNADQEEEGGSEGDRFEKESAMGQPSELFTRDNHFLLECHFSRQLTQNAADAAGMEAGSGGNLRNGDPLAPEME